jgi:hypothetical protein
MMLDHRKGMSVETVATDGNFFPSNFALNFQTEFQWCHELVSNCSLSDSSVCRKKASYVPAHIFKASHAGPTCCFGNVVAWNAALKLPLQKSEWNKS